MGREPARYVLDAELLRIRGGKGCLGAGELDTHPSLCCRLDQHRFDGFLQVVGRNCGPVDRSDHLRFAVHQSHRGIPGFDKLDFLDRGFGVTPSFFASRAGTSVPF